MPRVGGRFFIEGDMKESIYKNLRKVLYEENGYQKDFKNCFFNRMCQKVCGVQCKEHYIEGLTHVNMAGCFVMQYDENQAADFLKELIDMVDNRYIWDDGWKKV